MAAQHPAFLLAAVQENGYFSIITVEPDGYVSPAHNRMPLVLGPDDQTYGWA